MGIPTKKLGDRRPCQGAEFIILERRLDEVKYIIILSAGEFKNLYILDF